MKTKRQVCLAAAAAVAIMGLTVRADAAVVHGYVNKSLKPGFNFVANPLDSPPSNSIQSVLSPVPDDTWVWFWDVTNQTFTAPSVFYTGSGWSTNLTLPPGRGFVISVPYAWTITFVGDVYIGTQTNFLVGSNRLTLAASIVPQSLPLSLMAFPGADGMLVYFWDFEAQNYRDADTFFDGYGWHCPTGTNGPAPAVAEPFFVQNPGPDTNWVRTFVLNSLPARTKASAATQSDLGVRKVRINAGTVTLELLNPDHESYDVQFAADFCNWTTIATNQTGLAWTGACPRAAQGGFQIIGSQRR